MSVEDNTLVSVITSYDDFNVFTKNPTLPSDISVVVGNAFSTAAGDSRLSAISLNNVTVAGPGVLSGASHMTSVSALAL